MANAHIQLSFNKPVLDVPKASFILEAKLRQYSFDIGFGGVLFHEYFQETDFRDFPF